MIGSWTVCVALPHVYLSPALCFSPAINKLVTTKASTLTSFVLNVSDVSHVKIYGVGGISYSFNINWNKVDLYVLSLASVIDNPHKSFPISFGKKGHQRSYVDP